jgi:hypothetical protein
MKDEPKFFGPEVPGYAHLNEAIRQGRLKVGYKVQQPQKKARKSQRDTTKPK